MRAMNFLIIIVGLGSVIGTQTFVPMGKEKMVLYALLIGSSFNIVMNFILIPRYGVWGATLATLCSEGLLSGVELFWCRKIVDLRKVGHFFIIYLGNSMIMASGVFLCIKLIPGLWIGTIIAICTGVAIYGFLLLIEKNHFAMELIKILKRKCC